MNARFQTMDDMLSRVRHSEQALLQLDAVASPVVNSHNEWDPLEEVVVGNLDYATIPSAHPVVSSNVPGVAARLFSLVSGRRFPGWMVARAQQQLDGFVELLVSLGITVRRPAAVNHQARFSTPDWSARGFCTACPRDSLLVIGDEIIEVPMAWPTRYFETAAFRPLLKEYFARGARWTAAPKPQLTRLAYDSSYRIPAANEPLRYVTTEFEPLFDAADFVRCGRDLFVIRSNVTNDFGIDWLRRHLGPRYRIHVIESRCRQPMHIDTSFMPLAPGKVLINEEYIDPQRLPDVLRSWEVLIAPEPDPIDSRLTRLLSMCGKWLSMNVLMIDEKRVIVEQHHVNTIRAFEKWGFEPIPCPFLHYGPFGGAFHCATLDIRRRGTLQSYF